MAKDEQETLLRVTDIPSLKVNVEAAVNEFAKRWIPVPSFSERCEVMSLWQLRDAMGLRATFEAGDPWPLAENMLLTMGFRWHWMGGIRVMFLMEQEGYVDDGGWRDGEEIEDVP